MATSTEHVSSRIRTDETAEDKYTAAIELSNACRQFYCERLRAAEDTKKRLCLAPSIHLASLDLLKQEMSLLIDQDLILMRQLLTLNDQIEELKWQRKLRAYARDVPGYSSQDIRHARESTGYSSSDMMTDSWYSATDGGSGVVWEPRELPPKYPTPSSLSLLQGRTPQNSVPHLDMSLHRIIEEAPVSPKIRHELRKSQDSGCVASECDIVSDINSNQAKDSCAGNDSQQEILV